MGKEELKDHALGHTSLGLDSGQWLRTLCSGAGPHVPSMPGLEYGGRRQAPGLGRRGIPQNHPAPSPLEPLWALSLGRYVAPFWPVLPECGLSPRQLGKDPALPLPRSVLPPRSPSSVKGPSQDISAGPSAWPSAAMAPPASSVMPVTSSCRIQFTAATVLAGGSLDLSSIQVMVTMASPTAFSTRLLQELPKEPSPRPRFRLKSFSDPT